MHYPKIPFYHVLFINIRNVTCELQSEQLCNTLQSWGLQYSIECFSFNKLKWKGFIEAASKILIYDFIMYIVITCIMLSRVQADNPKL